MNQKRYKNTETVKLADYMEASRFRTVTRKQREEQIYGTDIPVEITAKESFIKKLTFPVPENGKLYGFVLPSGKLFEIFPELGLRDHEKTLELITLDDWDDRFLLVLKSNKEIAFFVSYEDVSYLLENCRRIPEQQYK